MSDINMDMVRPKVKTKLLNIKTKVLNIKTKLLNELYAPRNGTLCLTISMFMSDIGKFNVCRRRGF